MKKITKFNYTKLTLIGIISIGFIYFYFKIFKAKIHTSNGEKQYLYVPTHSNFKDLEKNLLSAGMLEDTADFEWLARLFHFGSIIRPGKYLVENGMNIRRLFRRIQVGDQVPVDLILHNLRLKENMISFVSRHLEADSNSLERYLQDSLFIDSLGFTKQNIYGMFLPNTYEFKWNTSALQFYQRMKEEYQKFWSIDRLEKAKEHGLSPIQVLILASIVNQESNRPEDMTLIAGVYINRLKAGMKLEADPTVVFAAGDFTIRRVTKVYLDNDSPYNTYRYKGLPPGPITMPSKQAIDAVLNSPNTNYMYFCAKYDFSGNHAFAVTREEHLLNARKFHEALNARNIH